ncbi:hypothetical protein [Psychrobacter sp. FDAARGOS_221]|uniref:hypothetical protein n=1 Tax=Psychrobacter sp. FDAARGOS_221 TaxID=1975705 RepID=UPI000BB5486E|nr:hypothetical protein [Psychrobacter sp. FDAARGOS_221]PNK61233.1 hypothetical protein A6J60_010350 [Psychrobacter sp. FDAARGOS_221]
MKKTVAFACLVGLSQLAVSQTALAKEYCNSRFDYCVDVPSQLKWMPESTNGDGRHFKLANSPAEILIYGSHGPSVLDYTDQQYLAAQKRDYHANTVVTYERKKGSTYTVSGYDENGRIYYHVIKVKNGTQAQLAFNYPKSEKQKMDRIVGQMARSFKLY